ncbi:hypothetical protein F2Q69_00006049 [Brassica cretica]|uniref:Uncharacterized protein n=1 Tax=Brassica cretica TaxID=69181 RepID=A0A8S9P562_BRACR|nr:hypothetical protein F2Q69_00006049 [Brassica cretica]
MDFRPGTRRQDGLSSWNPEAGQTFVLDPGGWMDSCPGTRRLDGLSSWNPEAGWTCVLEIGGWLNFCPGRLTDRTRCVRFVNLEYRDASHSTFRRWVTLEFFPRDSRPLLWTWRFSIWILGLNGTVVLFRNPKILLGPEGHFWSPEATLDLEVTFRTWWLSKDPNVIWEPGGSFRP